MLIFLIFKLVGIGILISVVVMIFSAIVKVLGFLPIGSVTASKKAIEYYNENSKNNKK